MLKLISVVLVAMTTAALTAAPSAQMPSFDVKRLEPHGVVGTRVTYRGREAIRLIEDENAPDEARRGLAVVRGVSLRDGTIDLLVAGAAAAGAPEGARGFVGVAFRLDADVSSFEHVYLRPTNARADDQVRRNHSVQYASAPDFPWPRLRKEFPEKYETYADLEPGAWTPMKIVVRGSTLRLHVHGAEQPTLVVNDLKLGDREGGIALWIGPGTEGHFANLRISP